MRGVRALLVGGDRSHQLVNVARAELPPLMTVQKFLRRAEADLVALVSAGAQSRLDVRQVDVFEEVAHRLRARRLNRPRVFGCENQVGKRPDGFLGSVFAAERRQFLRRAALNHLPVTDDGLLIPQHPAAPDQLDCPLLHGASRTRLYRGDRKGTKYFSNGLKPAWIADIRDV